MSSSKKYRLENPIKYRYQSLKDNAKRDGKVFELTFEYFKQFAVKNDLLEKAETRGQSPSVDRIENELGYIRGNIQKLSVSVNARKGQRKAYLLDSKGYYVDPGDMYPQPIVEIDQGDCPF